MQRLHHLTVMGRLELRNREGGAVTSVLAQPKRLGLLAYLAVARPEGFRARAEVLQLFWPEYDDRRARNALNTSINYLRRSLGDDVILSRGDDIGVNPERLWCDVQAFRQATREERWSAALALFGGELLPGLAAESVELERWIDNERRDLLREAVTVADAAAREALEQNDFRSALAAAHRAQELAPFDEQPVRTLMTIHARAGDMPAVAQVYDRFVDLLHRELELEPSEELQDWVPELSGSIGGSGAKEGSASTAGIAPAAPPTRSSRWLRPTQTQPRLANFRGIGLAAASIAALALLGAIGWWVLKPGAAAESTAGRSTAVLPFTTRGSERIAYLGDGLAGILAGRLDGVGELRTVDPNALIGYLEDRRSAQPLDLGRAAARHFSAGYFVLGDVTAVGDRLDISATLYDARGRPRARANAAATEGELLVAVDELARELAAGQIGGPGADLLREATVTTRSLPALKAYLEGERAYRENRVVDMRIAMERAIAEDSAFALAHYRLAIATEGSGFTEGGMQLIQRSVDAAMRHRGRLSDRHRLLLSAFFSYWRGNYGEAEEAYRRALLRYPDDVEAWHRLGELQFHRMPSLGKPFTEARTAFERVLALEPENASALQHLIRIAAVEGKPAQVDSFTERALVNAPDPQRIELTLIRAYANGDRAAQARGRAEVNALPYDNQQVIASRIASYTGDVAGGEAVVMPLIRPTQIPDVRVLGHLQLAEFAAQSGRWKEARQQLQELAPNAPVVALALETFLAILPFAPTPRADLVRLRQRVTDWNLAPAGVDSASNLRIPQPARPGLRQFFLAALALRLGDVTDATRQADQLAKDRVALSYGLPTLLRAMIALETRRPVDGLAALDSLTVGDPAFLFPRQDALMRFTRAQLLQAAGRDGDAYAWYGTFGDLLCWDLALLAPGELARAAIAQRRGDNQAAANHYSRALRMWQNADPELRPLVDNARSQLVQLSRGTR